ncbi:hypothetical protein [Paraburkholderia guartelaensis]|uniref:Uncharacterized protein n=1 Tax=Paraburkholderia guartelaensis TaxID=2546446 RepID=A0ABU9SJ43_9BURK
MTLKEEGAVPFGLLHRYNGRLARKLMVTGQAGVLVACNPYAILFRMQNAKKPATPVGKIEEFIGMLNRGETIYPQTGKFDSLG